jgi:hypothetical protein
LRSPRVIGFKLPFLTKPTFWLLSSFFLCTISGFFVYHNDADKFCKSMLWNTRVSFCCLGALFYFEGDNGRGRRCIWKLLVLPAKFDSDYICKSALRPVIFSTSSR